MFKITVYVNTAFTILLFPCTFITFIMFINKKVSNIATVLFLLQYCHQMFLIIPIINIALHNFGLHDHFYSPSHRAKLGLTMSLLFIFLNISRDINTVSLLLN